MIIFYGISGKSLSPEKYLYKRTNYFGGISSFIGVRNINIFPKDFNLKKRYKKYKERNKTNEKNQ